MAGSDLQDRLAKCWFVNVSSYNKNLPCDPEDMSKFPPSHTEFRPFDDVSPEDGLASVKELGFNGIRLMLFWENLEPVRQEYNEGYIKQVADFVRLCHGMQVDVILDFHQDLFSRRLGGSGAPDWALPHHIRMNIEHSGFIVPKDKRKFDHVAPCNRNWGFRYVIDRTQESAWAHWWGSADLRSDYVNMVRHVVQAVKSPAVIGVDIMNEPSTPEVFHGHLLARPWRFGAVRTQLAAFYSDAILALNAVVDRSVLFLVEPYWYDASQLAFFSIGMANLGLPESLAARTVLAAHLYQPFPRLRPNPRPLLRGIYQCGSDCGAAAVFIGEYGDLTFGSDSPKANAIIKDQTELFAATGTGWAFYNFSPSTAIWNEEAMSVVTPDLQPTPIHEVLTDATKGGRPMLLARIHASSTLPGLLEGDPTPVTVPLPKDHQLMVIAGARADIQAATDRAMARVTTQGPAEELEALTRYITETTCPLLQCVVVAAQFDGLGLTAEALRYRSFHGLVRGMGCVVVSFAKRKDAEKFAHAWGKTSALFADFDIVDLSEMGELQ